jgi:alkaline phosphatase
VRSTNRSIGCEFVALRREKPHIHEICPITVCNQRVNARAGLGWATYSHTAVPVPVMSNDASFNGYYDNTDVAKKIALIMGVSLD